MKRAFRLPGSHKQIERELDDELRFHLEGRIEELMVREHLSREAAEREARRRFGDVNAYRRETRDIDNVMLHRRTRMELIDAVRRESVHAARALFRAPSFSLIAILTLALGLGAATTIFTVLDRVVLRPLPYPNADRIVQISTLWPKVKAGEEYALSRGQYFYFKKNSNVLADILMYDSEMDVVLSDGARPAERVPMADVSASAFSLLGLRPEKGRLFIREQELAPNGQAGVAVISHEFWVRRFGSDPNIIGTKLQLAEQAVEIIGVLAPGASLPDQRPDVWIRNTLDLAIPTSIAQRFWCAAASS
jgi:putative ABC transport system permease protein